MTTEVFFSLTVSFQEEEEEEEEEDFAWTQGPLRGNSFPFSPLSRRELNPIKPVYDPHQPDGRLNLTASAFNQLRQYTISDGRRGYCYAELAVFFLTVAVTIASSHCAYPRRDAQAELPGWLVT